MRGAWLALGLVACAPKLRPFPNAAPVWVDSDEHHVADVPDAYWSGLAWDGVDQSLFQPLHRGLSLQRAPPAANVNAWDEVPDSSWFTNRIGVRDVTAAELAQGSCPDLALDPSGPWTVVGAKPNGANPGFQVADQHGRRFLLKFDGHVQPERATAADVIGSRLYHAAGYWSPCNAVVAFDPAILVIDPEAESDDVLGRPVPVTEDDIATVLAAAVPTPDGLLRASASLYLPGRPLGPWTYQGTRGDDPNDVIPHQDRRELRGARLLAAWLNHFDTREQNTLAIWVDDGGRTFVRHYYLDFGDSFGSIWEAHSEMLSRRFGHAYYFDLTDVGRDLATLGVPVRVWERVEIRDEAPIYGYFDVAAFSPRRWKGGYPNPAFRRMRDEDGAWMARILARFDDELVRAAVAEGQLSEPALRRDLERTLIGRRDAILDHYLQVRSPLADFEVDGTQVCFADLAALTGVTDPARVVYRSIMYFGTFHEPRWQRWENADRALSPGRVCVSLLHGADRPADAAFGLSPDALERYAVLDIEIVARPGAEPIGPARLHFYDQGPAGFRLVGIERPGDPSPPGR